jgi:prenyltransferase beta subunit
MLGEVLGMVDESRPGFERLDRVYLDAVNLILRAQNVAKDRSSSGGWRYHPNSTDSDISVTGWQLLALRAARDNGLPVPRRNIEAAVAYVKRCLHPLGGFGYQPGGEPTAARTGTGVLSIEICGEHQSPEALRGGEWLLKHPLEWRGPFFFYGVYYCSQAMYQLGGESWKTWRSLTESLLLPRQRGDGSWPAPPEETHELHAGTAYCTAMAALALSVDFKLLPIYQR